MSLLLAAAAVRQQAAAGSGFNPQTDITWHSLFWTEGSAFTALGLSDTDPVGTWSNETAESDAVQPTTASKPTFDASSASFNNRPVVTFDGGDLLVVSSWTSDIPANHTKVIIIRANRTAATEVFISGASNDDGRVFFQSDDSIALTVTSNQTSTGTRTTNPTLLVAKFTSDATNERMWQDGTLVLDTNAGNMGTTPDLHIGRNNSATFYFQGDMALVGIYDGDFTADASYADFESWVTSHYGITIA